MKKSKQTQFKDKTNENKTGKAFWNAIKPFMTNKGTITNDNVCICADTDERVIIKNEKDEVHTKANDLIKDYKLLVKIFSQHYTNIVERTSGSRSMCMWNLWGIHQDQIKTKRLYAKVLINIRISSTFHKLLPYIKAPMYFTFRKLAKQK